MVANVSLCRVCKQPAVIDLPRHNANFCAEHFLELCRRQVVKAIEKFDMLSKDDRVLVAVSGGKDSLAVWDLLVSPAGADLWLGAGAALPTAKGAIAESAPVTTNSDADRSKISLGNNRTFRSPPQRPRPNGG